MNQSVFREYMPFLPDWTMYLMYTVFFVVLIGVAWGIRNKLRNYDLKASELFRELKKAFKDHRKEIIQRMMVYVAGQRKLRRSRYAGIMHMCIFYGMIFLALGTFLVFLEQDVLKHFGVKHLLKGYFYLAYEIVLDLSGVLLVVGLGMAVFRRLFVKPPHLKFSREMNWILGSLFFIAITGFVTEGYRLAMNPIEWGKFSFVGYQLSKLFAMLPREFLELTYPGLWWVHFAAALVLNAAIPLTVLKHLILIPLNMALLPFDRSKAKMTTPFKVTELEEMGEESELKIGISCPSDLGWKEKLNLAACVNCGRCESVCPAFASGRSLSPRALVQKLKGTFDSFNPVQEEAKQANFFDTGLITEDEVWSCTNCGACVEECPAMIHHVDYIVDLRRYLVAENRVDAQKQSVFSNLDQNYNPFGLPSYKRNDWLEEMGVPLLENHPDAEYLYWVGDPGSYDPRAQQVVKSFVAILQAANVDFAVMTHEEKSCGEIAKRMGEEGRFQLIAMENIATLDGYGVKKIVTHDPHSFNMLKNEYPDFGGHYEVIHHTVLIRQLMAQGRISIQNRIAEKIVYHDPCNLARWNNICNEPRQVLSQVASTPLLEAERSRERTFCCGAGGGNYWYKVPAEEKISTLRLRQLSEVQPDIIAVGCPYCLLMLEDASRTSDSSVPIRDIAEIVAEQLQAYGEQLRASGERLQASGSASSN